MMSKYLASILATTSLSLAITAPAFAQEADDAISSADIVVTARRVEERLQDVPISITVFSQEQLDKVNMSSARELSTYTPSLSTNARFGADTASFAIRGFTQENRTTASVGVYFADVVAPRGGGATGTGGDGAGPGNMFDLQNVQVLKGPQGTLFGRNTTGGAVLLVPKKPTRDFEGYVEGTYGNYDTKRVQAVINVPVSETFRVRAGVDWQDSDGWLKNNSGVGPDRFADTHYIAARLSAVADLTPELENYTVASFSKSTPNGTIPKVTDCFPTGARSGNTAQFGIPLGNFACEQIEREQDLGRRSISNWLPFAHQLQETWQVINTTTWQASDTLTVKNIASYAQVRQNFASDLFGIGIPLGATINLPNFMGNSTQLATLNVPTAYQGGYTGSSTAIAPPGLNAGEQSTFTEELQFQGRSFGGKLNWQAGAYFELSDPLNWAGTQSMDMMFCNNIEEFNNLSCTNILPQIALANGWVSAAATNSLMSGSMNKQLARTQYRNIGLYTQGTYDITDQLKFTAGIRYTWDRTIADSMRANFTFNTDINGDGILNDANGVCNDPNDVYGGDLRNCAEHFEQKSDAPTWVLGLDYKINPDILLYAKYSRGYRQGAANPFAPFGFGTFEPEKVDTYEAGFKTSFRGSVPGTFNVTAFYNDFSNQQLEVAFLDLIGNAVVLSPNVAIVNAGKSRIYGVETEATVSPFKGLTLSASYAYINSKLQQFVTPTLPDETVPGTPDGYDTIGKAPSAGTVLPYTPKHKLVLNGQYRLPIEENIGKISLGATYVYTSKIFYGEFTYNDAFRAESIENFDDLKWGPSTDLVNLNVNYENIMQSGVDLSFYATNIFGEKYYVDRSASGNRGYGIRYLGTPAMYGVKLRYNF